MPQCCKALSRPVPHSGEKRLDMAVSDVSAGPGHPEPTTRFHHNENRRTGVSRPVPDVQRKRGGNFAGSDLGWRAVCAWKRRLEQLQPVLQLRDAELELLEVVAGDQAQVREEIVERAGRPLTDARRLGAPAAGHVLD